MGVLFIRFDSIIPYCPHHPTSEHPSFFITIIMGMNSSRLMAVAAILAALTSIEVEACLGEPCKIGNPTMCRLIRETNRAGSVSTHSSLLGEPMPDAHRRLVSTRRRMPEEMGARFCKTHMNGKKPLSGFKWVYKTTKFCKKCTPSAPTTTKKNSSIAAGAKGDRNLSKNGSGRVGKSK